MARKKYQAKKAKKTYSIKFSQNALLVVGLLFIFALVAGYNTVIPYLSRADTDPTSGETNVSGGAANDTSSTGGGNGSTAPKSNPDADDYGEGWAETDPKTGKVTTDIDFNTGIETTFDPDTGEKQMVKDPLSGKTTNVVTGDEEWTPSGPSNPLGSSNVSITSHTDGTQTYCDSTGCSHYDKNGNIDGNTLDPTAESGWDGVPGRKVSTMPTKGIKSIAQQAEDLYNKLLGIDTSGKEYSENEKAKAIEWLIILITKENKDTQTLQYRYQEATITTDCLETCGSQSYLNQCLITCLQNQTNTEQSGQPTQWKELNIKFSE